MKLKDGLLMLGGVAVGMFAYGHFIEARRLTVEKRKLVLKGWPARLDGYTIAFVTDFHVTNFKTLDLARRAIRTALESEADIVVIGGDMVSHWSAELPHVIGDLLEPLRALDGRVIAIAGNRDYDGGPAETLRPIYSELGIKFLRNESISFQGIQWVGVDSLKAGKSNLEKAFADIRDSDEPVVVLWHEPDHVNLLPERAVLQLSGHSHGGQFVLPGGFVPKKSEYGERYLQGFFEDTATPLYVSRGVGTTFLNARFLCPPEVSILTLKSTESIA
jgi:predicted MPP superfamily phosphohydrolase